MFCVGKPPFSAPLIAVLEAIHDIEVQLKRGEDDMRFLHDRLGQYKVMTNDGAILIRDVVNDLRSTIAILHRHCNVLAATDFVIVLRIPRYKPPPPTKAPKPEEGPPEITNEELICNDVFADLVRIRDRMTSLFRETRRVVNDIIEACSRKEEPSKCPDECAVIPSIITQCPAYLKLRLKRLTENNEKWYGVLQKINSQVTEICILKRNF